MTLYHGTSKHSSDDILSNGIDLTRGHRFTDFGRGFYTTPSREAAERWAARKSYLDDPVIICFYFDDKDNKDIIHRFEKSDLDWAQFIVNNRNGYEYMKVVNNFEHNQDGKYMVVCGQICDGEVTKIARKIAKEERLVSEDDLKKLINQNYPEQYSFHSDKALELLKLTKIITL